MGNGCCCRSQAVAVLEYPNRSLIRNKLLSAENEQSIIELSTSLTGKKIQWKRKELIGQGAYAKVYLCEDKDTGNSLAVKHFTLSSVSSKAQREFALMHREISLLRFLDHPHIVQYFQTDLNDTLDSFYVLLEYVPGGSLKQLLNDKIRLADEEVSHLGRQLLLGLKYLHSVGVIHRDLKSANVLITEEGDLKIADFGASRKFEIEDSELSKSVRGSPYWMAPEVVRKEGHSYACDIWSFGCLLIEMNTGKPPWSEYSSRAQEVLNLIATNDSLPNIPKCSEELKTVIQACLQRDPKKRPTANKLLQCSFFSAI